MPIVRGWLVATRVTDGTIHENVVVLVDSSATLLVKLSTNKKPDK